LSGREVGRGGIAARSTGERLLGLAIGLESKAALWATPAGVARIDGNDRDTTEPRLGGHKPAKLTERPPMQTVALRSCGLNPRADMREAFNRNGAAGAFNGKRTVSMRRKLILAGAALALLTGAASAQTPTMGGGGMPMPGMSLGRDKPPPTADQIAKQKAIDDAYKSATQKIPDKKTADDPWATVRPNPSTASRGK